ncbi:MAG: hypothetical protein KC983_06265, partial [Phycisphaerales bacterium]|nr:hypothetical protein [Phycisphaerales bacterium]
MKFFGAMSLHDGRVLLVAQDAVSSVVDAVHSDSHSGCLVHHEPELANAARVIKSPLVHRLERGRAATLNVAALEEGPAVTTETLDLFCTNLGIDVDNEYFAHFDSVESCQAWVEAIVLGLNGQFEYQTQITHKIEILVIRETEESEPVDMNPDDNFDFVWPDSNLIVEEWNTTFADNDWDIAHVLTGTNLAGFGFAQLSSVCNAPIAEPYSLAEYLPNLFSAVRLTAHEIGHNWSGQHEICFACTMSTTIPHDGREVYFRLDPANIRRITTFRETIGDCAEACDSLTITRRELPMVEDFSSRALEPDNWSRAESPGANIDDNAVSIQAGGSLTSTHFEVDDLVAIENNFVWSAEASAPVDDGVLVVEVFERGYQWLGRSTIPVSSTSEPVAETVHV